MQYYVLSKDGKLVGITYENPYQMGLVGVSIHEFDSVDDPYPDLEASRWNGETETFETSDDIMTRREFLVRFTLMERIAIRSSTDPIIIDIMDMLDLAAYVRLTDITTIQSVQYIASVGLIQPSRVQEILG